MGNKSLYLLSPIAVASNGKSCKRFSQYESNNWFKALFEDVLFDVLSVHDENIRIKSNKSFIYLVEPFGSFSQFLGKQTQFSEWNFIDFISTHALTEIKNTPNFYLHINFSTEGVFEEHLIVYLYELFKKYEIPANKVIFTISSVDIEEIHNKIISRYH